MLRWQYVANNEINPSRNERVFYLDIECMNKGVVKMIVSNKTMSTNQHNTGHTRVY